MSINPHRIRQPPPCLNRRSDFQRVGTIQFPSESFQPLWISAFHGAL
jgi:hypothetical protein